MLSVYWCSVNFAGEENDDCPVPLGRITWGVGIRYWPLGSLNCSNFSEIGLIFDPSRATATPPCCPLLPPNSAPSAAADRSLVRGGRNTDADPAVDSPLRCCVPWYEPKKNVLSFLIGPPKTNPY